MPVADCNQHKGKGGQPDDVEGALALPALPDEYRALIRVAQ